MRLGAALSSFEIIVAVSTLETRETTILVIAHRLSTVVQADRIYVIDDGRVVEQGSYDELIDAKGRFEHMAQASTSGFVRRRGMTP